MASHHSLSLALISASWCLSMPILNGSSDFHIHGGHFYDVSGNLNMQHQQEYVIRLPDAGERAGGARESDAKEIRGVEDYRTAGILDNAGKQRVMPPQLPFQLLYPSGVGNFLGAENTAPAHGGTFITAGNMTSVQRYGDTGITILHRAVALEALRDSADSFPQPKCHPETRSQTLDMLWAWATKANRHKHILWLCGPAGAGKSAIVQTLSQRLQAAKYLAPSFFFKRGHVTRGTAKVLFATLAYQMALQHPRLRTRISQIAEDDPSIVGRTASVQLQELVVEPCQSVAETDLVPILLIDGLDECESPEIQQHVLQSIGNAFRERRLPFKILIASRPEPHIQETFQGSHLKGLYHTLPLNQSFEDVEHYLRDEFARIHREHCSTMCTVPTPWPSADTIATLLSKSSGHFIYASTIIKYIDDKNFRPNERLRLVENFGATDSGSPFATLDQLYIQILSAIPAQQRLFRILTVLVVFSELSLSQIEQLLDVQRGDVPLALRGLHSVLRIPTDYSHPITVYHASFLDFLDNPARSGVFCVRDAQKQEDLAVSVIKMLDSLTSFHYVAWEIKWIDYVTTSIPPSTSLIPLVRRIDCSFLYGKGFSNCRREQCLRNMVCWLEKTQPPPDDSIQMWRDYEFLAFCDTTFFLVARGDFWEQPLTQLQSKAFDELLLKSPELHRILDAWWICSDTRDGCLRRSPNLACIRLLLNLSWNQMTTAICLLRPFTTDGRERDELFQFLVRGSLLCREKYPLGRLDLYERIKGFIRRQRLADLGLQFEDIKREYFGLHLSAHGYSPLLYSPPLSPPDDWVPDSEDAYFNSLKLPHISPGPLLSLSEPKKKLQGLIMQPLFGNIVT